MIPLHHGPEADFLPVPRIARTALRLLDAGHAIPLVLTQPDRPAGRGMETAGLARQAAGAGHGIPVAPAAGSLRLDGKYPEDAAAAQAAIAAAQADAMVVAAYG